MSINVPSDKARVRIDNVAKDLQLLKLSMIVWLGSAQIVGLGLQFAALKLT